VRRLLQFAREGVKTHSVEAAYSRLLGAVRARFAIDQEMPVGRVLESIYIYIMFQLYLIII